MRVLVITSRYTAYRDTVKENFGRQMRLFEALARRGYEIDFFCIDYKKKERRDLEMNGLNIMIRPFSALRILEFAKALDRTVKLGNYDLILATSEPLWGVFGYYYAKKHQKPFVYDLHDNYEVYVTYKIPFYKYLDNYIMRKADIVTTVSHALKEKIRQIRSEKVYVIQNGVDTKVFKPVPKTVARKKLGLPIDKKIIAYAGSIQKAQGVHLLIKAFKLLQRKHDKLILLLAGKITKGKAPVDVNHPGIIHKSLDQKGANLVINAADVVVLPNDSNAFTKYCFHYKIAEYMACERPIVATRVGDVERLLEGTDSELCTPGNVGELAEGIARSLGKGRVKGARRIIMKNNTWDAIARILDGVIKGEIKKKR